MFLFQNRLALAHFSAGSYAEAAQWARASNSASPRFTANICTLIAALTATGADQKARVAAERLLELEPDFTLSRYEQRCSQIAILTSLPGSWRHFVRPGYQNDACDWSATILALPMIMRHLSMPAVPAHGKG
jgi:hypothetical protein